MHTELSMIYIFIEILKSCIELAPRFFRCEVQYLQKGISAGCVCVCVCGRAGGWVGGYVRVCVLERINCIIYIFDGKNVHAICIAFCVENNMIITHDRPLKQIMIM